MMMNNFMTSLTRKIIEETVDKIDVNDLYNRFPDFKKNLLFQDFYDYVKATDPSLAKKIDDWFLKNTKKILLDSLSEQEKKSEGRIIDLTPKPEVVKINPPKSTPRYEPDPCSRGYFGGRVRC